MNLETFDMIASKLLQEAARIQAEKRPAYTIGDEDVLANFKRIAERTGTTPGQVGAVYMLKHTDAVTAALCKPEIPQAEEVIGRFADHINYLLLTFALYVEGEKEGAATERAGARKEGGNAPAQPQEAAAAPTTYCNRGGALGAMASGLESTKG